MTPDKFIELVKQMRAAQCDYFAFHGMTRLIEAKRLEKMVDQALAKGSLEPDEEPVLEADLMTEEQIGLFDEPDAGDLLDTSA